MDDKLEKKLKELLPYIIIEAIIFFLMPLFMGHSEGAVTYIIEVGVFPLTALGCGLFYKYKMKRSDLYVCIIAPVFYAVTALLYGMWRASAITVLIYMVSYFVCGYLGLLLGDILLKKKGKDAPQEPPVQRPSLSPERVNLEEHEPAQAEAFHAENPEEDQTLDTATTDDDIEALLSAIRNRKD